MTHEIAGRDDELELVRRWLARPGAGALVLAGEAGIGKTTIWRRCVDDAAGSGARVLACAPTEAEAALPYAALADLLTPALPDVVTALPARQRRALEAALVLGDAGSALLDERAVAFATLTALRAAAGRDRLVVAVDDTQWLDPSSAVVLAYALRRVAAAEEVRAILARRVATGGEPDPVVEAFPPELVETIDLGPLSIGALHRAIRTHLGSALPRPALIRVHEASGGRPLHALELARAVGRTSGGVRAVPGAGVDDLLRGRVTELPARTRRALLLAAAATDTTLATLDPFVDGSVRSALDPALRAGLVRIDGGRVLLAHPLLADAVIAASGPASVAAAHRLLAGSARRVEERAVHLARAADGPDAAIASSLDAAVVAARARGAPTAASELAELAAGVTPPEDEGWRLRRLLEAADAAFVAGDIERAQGLLATVTATEHPLRHRALWRLGVLLDETAGPDAAIGPLREALGTADEELASAVHRSITQLLLYTGDVLAAVEHANDAVAAAQRSGSAEAHAYSLGVLAFARQMAGAADWEQILDHALDHERSTPLPDLDLSPSALAADLYRNSFALDSAQEAYARLHDAALERQDVRLEAWAAYGFTHVALLGARLDEAGRLAADLFDLAEQTGLMRLPAMRCLALHAALTGRTEEARRLLAEIVAECEERGELLNLRATLVIEGQLELSLGNAASAADALARARRIAEEQHVSPQLLVTALADEVEALTLAGEADEAARVAATLAHVAQPRAAAVVARAAGLAAAARGELAEAIGLLRSATEPGVGSPLPLEQARSWLALGRTLRRAKRRGEAREALAEARRRLEEIGAPLWAARAAEELSRTAGRAPAGAELTPTERRIATLVAEGRSNKEAAAALFVSVKTVEVTLTRVYRKLGVRRRAELAARFDELLKS